MLAKAVASGRVLAVRLEPDEDLLLGIRKAVEENQVRTALILSGVGSLKRFRVHVVGLPMLPTRDEFVTGEGPFDIVNVNGLVLDGRVHAHVTFADTQRAMGGHLEEGCKVLTFAAVTLVDLPDADLTDWDRPGNL